MTESETKPLMSRGVETRLDYLVFAVTVLFFARMWWSAMVDLQGTPFMMGLATVAVLLILGLIYRAATIFAYLCAVVVLGVSGIALLGEALDAVLF